MTKPTVFAALVICAGAWVAPTASEQPPADCTAERAEHSRARRIPCIFPDNRVMFRVAAPDAQKVRVRIGQGFDMSKARTACGT